MSERAAQALRASSGDAGGGSSSPATDAAGTLTAMPLPQDLSDQRMLFQQNLATEDFTAAVLAAHATLDAEAAATGSGRILTLSVTPWLMGQPHRAKAFAEMLDAVLARGSVWNATGADIAAAWKEQVG